MAGCDLDFSALPILSGCPADTELFLTSNAPGGLDPSGGFTTGYGRRYWSDLRKCAVKGVVFAADQLKVGTNGMNPGDSAYTINVAGILSKSVFVTLGGTELPQSDGTQISYTVDYTNPAHAVVTFNQPAQSGQQYIVHYAYSS